ncbi:hypothetical protein ACJMK2_019457 [Sinanodonta woodiana]|uniref:4'-phosphopantetheine phosphatase n=1 Tax=Sinanodonta woodiana TaxID=1069815 RepID=A0ABD3UJI6_SINWO
MTDESYAKSIELPTELQFRNLKTARSFAIDIGRVDKEDEMECLIKGCNFLFKNIPDEVFIYQRHGSPEYKFQGVDHYVFPYLLVNIGSGVSLVKVESESKCQRIGGTSTGGGTFWGLGSILTGAKTFDELLELAERGDHRTVDMLVKDIYGGAYSNIGLPGDVIASSFGKAARSPKDSDSKKISEPLFKEEDMARSLLLAISNDIGQIAYLQARLHGLKKIYFGGYFIRGHPITMNTITYAINFWSKGEIQPLFLRHEGYLGAIGAFLKGEEEDDIEKYSWGENFACSSSLPSPKSSKLHMGRLRSSMQFDSLELDKLEKSLLPCPLLLDSNSYHPDTVDLTQDTPARLYWIQCFIDGVDKQKQQAIKSQATSSDVSERADQFKQIYVQRLEECRSNPCAYGSLTVRSILDMCNQCLNEFQFTDSYSQQKQYENEQALRYLESRLAMLDDLCWEDQQLELVTGMLTGNVFDWGAKEVVEMMEKEKFGFIEAQKKLQARPWLIDDFEKWKLRLSEGPTHRCAVIFCDNSGADIILGVFPMARELLRRGSKQVDLVILEGMGRAIHTNFYAAFSCEVLKVAVLKNKWLAQRLGGDMFSVIFKYEKPRKISVGDNGR